MAENSKGQQIVDEWFPTERGKRPLIEAIDKAIAEARRQVFDECIAIVGAIEGGHHLNGAVIIVNRADVIEKLEAARDRADEGEA